MIRENEEELLMREACFAVKKGMEEGEKFFYTMGELYYFCVRAKRFDLVFYPSLCENNPDGIYRT